MGIQVPLTDFAAVTSQPIMPAPGVSLPALLEPLLQHLWDTYDKSSLGSGMQLFIYSQALQDTWAH